jgi:hypothetical protein
VAVGLQLHRLLDDRLVPVPEPGRHGRRWSCRSSTGNETPTVESADADFDTLGVQFRGYHDFGCDQAEYLAA